MQRGNITFLLHIPVFQFLCTLVLIMRTHRENKRRCTEVLTQWLQHPTTTSTTSAGNDVPERDMVKKPRSKEKAAAATAACVQGERVERPVGRRVWKPVTDDNLQELIDLYTTRCAAKENIYAQMLQLHGPMETWDISRVTSLYRAFDCLRSFNVDISRWDTSNVTNMSLAFMGCVQFNQPVGRWNVSRVRNMHGMFQGCTTFNQSLKTWDVSKVQSMAQMFYGAKQFSQPLDKWNVSNVLDMRNMFGFNCRFGRSQSICRWNPHPDVEWDNMFTELGRATAVHPEENQLGKMEVDASLRVLNIAHMLHRTNAIFHCVMRKYQEWLANGMRGKGLSGPRHSCEITMSHWAHLMELVEMRNRSALFDWIGSVNEVWIVHLENDDAPATAAAAAPTNTHIAHTVQHNVVVDNIPRFNEYLPGSQMRNSTMVLTILLYLKDLHYYETAELAAWGLPEHFDLSENLYFTVLDTLLPGVRNMPRVREYFGNHYLRVSPHRRPLPAPAPRSIDTLYTDFPALKHQLTDGLWCPSGEVRTARLVPTVLSINHL